MQVIVAITNQPTNQQPTANQYGFHGQRTVARIRQECSFHVQLQMQKTPKKPETLVQSGDRRQQQKTRRNSHRNSHPPTVSVMDQITTHRLTNRLTIRGDTIRGRSHAMPVCPSMNAAKAKASRCAPTQIDADFSLFQCGGSRSEFMWGNLPPKGR